MQCHMRTMHQTHIAIGIHSNHKYLNKKENSLKSQNFYTHIQTTRSRCVVAILDLGFDESQVGKSTLFFHIAQTITIHNLDSLNLSKRWWFRVTLDPSLSHKCVIGLQSWGGSMIDWAWFYIVNLKKNDCSSRIGLAMAHQPQQSPIPWGDQNELG